MEGPFALDCECLVRISAARCRGCVAVYKAHKVSQRQLCTITINSQSILIFALATIERSLCELDDDELITVRARGDKVRSTKEKAFYTKSVMEGKNVYILL